MIMAQRKPVRIDDETRIVRAGTKIIDVVPNNVQSITTQDGTLIPRDAFARVLVPDGFETNLSVINKGRESAPVRPRTIRCDMS
jgi:hypothetical protein